MSGGDECSIQLKKTFNVGRINSNLFLGLEYTDNINGNELVKSCNKF